MKLRPLILLLAAVFFLSGCGGAAPDLSAFTAPVASYRQQIAEAQGQIDALNKKLADQAATAAAAGNPTAAKVAALETQIQTLRSVQPDPEVTRQLHTLQSQVEALAKQPASGVSATDASAAKIQQQIADAATGALNTVGKAVQDFNARLAAAATQPDPKAAATGAIIQGGAAAVAPAAGPYAPLVKFGGWLIGGIVAGVMAGKVKKANSTSQSLVDAVQLALSSGEMQATPAAAGMINSKIIDHPIANQLVDVVTASAAASPLNTK